MKQLKDPEAFARMMKRYGPGFVALSKKSGRVVAHAREFGKLWQKIRGRKSFKEDGLKITHVPGYGTKSVYQNFP